MTDEAIQAAPPARQKVFVGHLLITPSTYRPALKQAIVDAAVAAGLSIDGYGRHDAQSVIYFVETATDLEKKAPDHLMLALRLSPKTAAEDLPFVTATALLSSLSDLPGDARIVDVDALEEGTALEVFPGVVVALPPRPSETDVTPPGVALNLFRDGAVKPGASAEWPLELFSFEPKAVVTGVRGELNLPGRARCLMWGPYFQLPPGTWRVRIEFSADEMASRHHFRFEWGGSDFGQLAFTPGKSGVYQAELVHSWFLAEMVELRLIMPASALNGMLWIRRVEVEMVAGAD